MVKTPRVTFLSFLTLAVLLTIVPLAHAEPGSSGNPGATPQGVAVAPLLNFDETVRPEAEAGLAWVPASTARAAESTWTWVGAIYLHMVDISGRQVIGPVEVVLDVGFGDLFDKLDGAFSGHFEGRNGNFGFGIDYVWVKVGEEGIEIGPADSPGIIGLEGAGSMTTSAFEFFGTYRIGDQAVDAGAFDFLGGIRYKSIKNALDITGLPNPIGGDSDQSWWDFLLGGRWMRQAGNRAVLILRADIGSDAWNVQGGIGINIWRQLDILVEYRHIMYNRQHISGGTRFIYDASESGPLFGFGFHF